MKELIKTSRTAGYLEKIFRELNADSFHGELDEPIITIQSSKGAYGHVTVCKTWKRKDDWRHELNIGAEYLDRPIEEVVATLIHEMVHLYNIKHNIQDCSRDGTYHNTKFRDEAVKHMISIAKHETYGWTLTSPTDELLEYILNKGWGEIRMRKGYFGFSGGSDAEDKPKTPRKGADDGEVPKKSGSRRYVCPGCKAIVRATRDVRIRCVDCELDFELT